MAKKKAELESDACDYGSRVAQALEAEKGGRYAEALAAAMSAWPCIDGMLQYAKRYEERQLDGIQAIALVLKYAPALLHYRSLHQLASLLDDQKRIERGCSDDVRGQLADAQRRLADYHRLWRYLAAHPNAPQPEVSKHLGGDSEYWRRQIDSWTDMGVVHRTSRGGAHCLRLSTDMNEVVSGKCSECGKRVESSKASFLAARSCPACKKQAQFVILGAMGS